LIAELFIVFLSNTSQHNKIAFRNFKKVEMISVELINYVIYVQITLGKKIIICCSMCVIWQYSSIPRVVLDGKATLPIVYANSGYI